MNAFLITDMVSRLRQHFIAVFAFHPSDYQPDDAEDEWPEYFHIPVLMLMLITLLNDGTLITIAYDKAEASRTPNSWNIPALFVASSVLGMVSCFSSLLLLFFLLDSHNSEGLFQSLGISSVDYGQNYNSHLFEGIGL